jgi:small-conductance mechanosensitive channel
MNFDSTQLKEKTLNWFLAGESFISELTHAFIFIGVGVPLVLIGAHALSKFMTARYSVHAGMIAKKCVSYLGMILILISVLMSFKLNLSALLGTAGIASMALGFAAKTSLSNLVSGIFLLAEKSFGVGDYIQVGSNEGYVISIDLLSVKIRTSDNLYVRVPNENILQGNVVNMTRYDHRRIHVNVLIGYAQSLHEVMKILKEASLKVAMCLDQPEPSVRLTQFSEGGITAELLVWCKKEDVLIARTQLIAAIQESYQASGCQFPQARP